MVGKIFAKPKKVKKSRPAKAVARKPGRATALPDTAPLPTASPERTVEAVPAVLTAGEETLPILAFAPVVPLPAAAGEAAAATGSAAANGDADGLPILAFAPVVPLPELERAETLAEAAPPSTAASPPATAEPAFPLAAETPVEVQEEAPVLALLPVPDVSTVKPAASALKPVPPALLEQPESDDGETAAEPNPEEVILASIPIPQWRPDVSGGMLPEKRDPAYIDPATGTRATSPAEELACRARLNELGVDYAELGFIGDPDGCAVTNPISVKSLGAGIALKPATTMNCAMAAATASFAQETLAASARSAFGSDLAAIEHASAYMCRPRHGLQKLSEHAFGNALDITAFRLKDDRRIEVRDTDITVEADFLAAVRTAACGPFKTVLGPGNADHDTHFHFDLQPRKRGGAYCP
ncbi:MAG: extensin family protein [Rhizobiaceae bacterium]|nr:extensin family protein [Rhizobiaceae bacterium]